MKKVFFYYYFPLALFLGGLMFVLQQIWKDQAFFSDSFVTSIPVEKSFGVFREVAGQMCETKPMYIPYNSSLEHLALCFKAEPWISLDGAQRGILDLVGTSQVMFNNQPYYITEFNLNTCELITLSREIQNVACNSLIVLKRQGIPFRQALLERQQQKNMPQADSSAQKNRSLSSSSLPTNAEMVIPQNTLGLKEGNYQVLAAVDKLTGKQHEMSDSLSFSYIKEKNCFKIEGALNLASETITFEESSCLMPNGIFTGALRSSLSNEETHALNLRAANIGGDIYFYGFPIPSIYNLELRLRLPPN